MIAAITAVSTTATKKLDHHSNDKANSLVANKVSFAAATVSNHFLR